MSKNKSINDLTNLFESFIKENSSKTYGYYINLDERGVFSADVRDVNGKTVFEIHSDDDGDVWIISDGFMKNKEDIFGLERYLRDMNIIESNAEVFDAQDAEKEWEHEKSKTPVTDEDLEESATDTKLYIKKVPAWANDLDTLEGYDVISITNNNFYAIVDSVDKEELSKAKSNGHIRSEFDVEQVAEYLNKVWAAGEDVYSPMPALEERLDEVSNQQAIAKIEKYIKYNLIPEEYKEKVLSDIRDAGDVVDMLNVYLTKTYPDKLVRAALVENVGLNLYVDIVAVEPEYTDNLKFWNAKLNMFFLAPLHNSEYEPYSPIEAKLMIRRDDSDNFTLNEIVKGDSVKDLGNNLLAWFKKNETNLKDALYMSDKTNKQISESQTRFVVVKVYPKTQTKTYWQDYGTTVSGMDNRWTWDEDNAYKFKTEKEATKVAQNLKASVEKLEESKKISEASVQQKSPSGAWEVSAFVDNGDYLESRVYYFSTQKEAISDFLEEFSDRMDADDIETLQNIVDSLEDEDLEENFITNITPQTGDKKAYAAVLEDAKQASAKLNEELKQLFPTTHAVARVEKGLGEYVTVSFISVPRGHTKNLDFWNAELNFFFMIHLGDAHGEPYKSFEATIHVRHGAKKIGLKYRKISGSTVSEVLTKLGLWFKKNQELLNSVPLKNTVKEMSQETTETTSAGSIAMGGINEDSDKNWGVYQVRDDGLLRIEHENMSKDDAQRLAKKYSSSKSHVGLSTGKQHKFIAKEMVKETTVATESLDKYISNSGKPYATTPKEFDLGGLWRYEQDDDNRIQVYKEHGSYQIAGFVGGKHIRQAYRTFSEMKSAVRKLKREMKVNSIQEGDVVNFPKKELKKVNLDVGGERIETFNVPNNAKVDSKGFYIIDQAFKDANPQISDSRWKYLSFDLEHRGLSSSVEEGKTWKDQKGKKSNKNDWKKERKNKEKSREDVMEDDSARGAEIADSQNLEDIKYAIASLGFLLPANEKVTAQEFAKLIKDTYDDERTAYLADVLEKSSYGFIKSEGKVKVFGSKKKVEENQMDRKSIERELRKLRRSLDDVEEGSKEEQQIVDKIYQLSAELAKLPKDADDMRGVLSKNTSMTSLDFMEADNVTESSSTHAVFLVKDGNETQVSEISSKERAEVLAAKWNREFNTKTSPQGEQFVAKEVTTVTEVADVYNVLGVTKQVIEESVKLSDWDKLSETENVKFRKKYKIVAEASAAYKKGNLILVAENNDWKLYSSSGEFVVNLGNVWNIHINEAQNKADVAAVEYLDKVKLKEDVAKKHQVAIAKKTLKMSDVGAKIAGGMSKEEARNVLKTAGWTDEKITKFEDEE